MEISGDERKLLPIEDDNATPNQQFNDASDSPPPPTGVPSQQVIPPQQGYQIQQGIPLQQGIPPQQGILHQQGIPPQQGYQIQQGIPFQQGIPIQQGIPPQQGYPTQQGIPLQQGFPTQQGINPQQGYGQPLPYQQNNNNAIVVNQAKPTYLVSGQVKFRDRPVSIVCPYCKNVINTVISHNFSCCACCFCVLGCCIVLPCIQCINGKSLGCFDTKHTCPKCGAVLGGPSCL